MSAVITKIIFFLALIIYVISRPQLDTENSLNNENEPFYNSFNDTNITAENNFENYDVPCFDENGNKLEFDSNQTEANNSCVKMNAVLYISTAVLTTLQGP